MYPYPNPMAGGAAAALDISKVYSAKGYTGNGSTQSVVTGLDLVNNPGMVHIKCRTVGYDNWAYDTIRGRSSALYFNAQNGPVISTAGNDFASFNTNGFTLGPAYQLNINQSGQTFWSRSWVKAPKFFTLVSWTGNGVGDRSIPHDLGITPGLIVVKAQAAATDWYLWHRSTSPATAFITLNSTNAAVDAGSPAYIFPSSTDFFVHQYNTTYWGLNTNGVVYTAYLWAHDPSATGVIQCGSYVGNSSTSGPVVNLGWEPQSVVIRAMNQATHTVWVDQGRNASNAAGTADLDLTWNGAYAENALYGSTNIIDWQPTGFQMASTAALNSSGFTYLYMAVRKTSVAAGARTRAEWNAYAATLGTNLGTPSGAFNGNSIGTGNYSFVMPTDVSTVWGNLYNNGQWVTNDSNMGAALTQLFPSATEAAASKGVDRVYCEFGATSSSSFSALTRNGIATNNYASAFGAIYCNKFVYWDATLGKARQLTPFTSPNGTAATDFLF